MEVTCIFLSFSFLVFGGHHTQLTCQKNTKYTNIKKGKIKSYNDYVKYTWGGNDVACPSYSSFPRHYVASPVKLPSCQAVVFVTTRLFQIWHRESPSEVNSSKSGVCLRENSTLYYPILESLASTNEKGVKRLEHPNYAYTDQFEYVVDLCKCRH